MTTHHQILKDANGNDPGVFLPIKDYNAIMVLLEEMEDVRDYDAAMKSDEIAIPFEQAISEIEPLRNEI